MGIFEALRDPGWNTFYGSLRTHVLYDIDLVAVAYMSALVTLACSVLLVGSRRQEIISNTVRMSVFLMVTIGILVIIYSSHWQTMACTVTSRYSLHDQRLFRGSVYVDMGLNSVNVSMIGDVNSSHVHYNERLSWWGVNDAEIGYRAALRKGLPVPLLDVLEYFSLGIGELDLDKTWEIRIAGYYSFILLWSSLTMWLIGSIMTFLVPSESGIVLSLTGCLLLVTIIVYVCTRSRYPLVIRIAGRQMTPVYGWSLYLTGCVGLIALAYGAAILILHRRSPASLRTWFGIARDEDAEGNLRYATVDSGGIEDNLRPTKSTVSTRHTRPVPSTSSTDNDFLHQTTTTTPTTTTTTTTKPSTSSSSRIEIRLKRSMSGTVTNCDDDGTKRSLVESPFFDADGYLNLGLELTRL